MLGDLISAGMRLAGGFMDRSAQNKTQDRQIAESRQAIQTRVTDAKAAGVSPLFALGANVSTPSLQSVGGMGDAMGGAGQDIGRAVNAFASPQVKGSALANDLAKVQLEGARVDNDIKRATLLSMMNKNSQPGTPPGMVDSDTFSVMPGQGNAAGGIKLEKKISPAGYLPQKSFSVSPEIDMYRTVQGYSPEVPQDLGEAHESQPLAAAQWFLRNKLAPHFSESWRTYPYSAPSDSYWTFDPLFGQYVLVKKGGSFNNRANKWEHLMERFRR